MVLDVPATTRNEPFIDPSVRDEFEVEIVNMAEHRFPSLRVVEFYFQPRKPCTSFLVTRDLEGKVVGVTPATGLSGWISPGLEDLVPRM